MPRTHTVRNPLHPHNQFRDFIQKLKVEYRQMNATALSNVVSFVFNQEAKRAEASGSPAPRLPVHRHEQIEFLMRHHEAKFKEEWLAQRGWPFDDVYDKGKMAQHRAEEHAKSLGEAKEPLVTDEMLREAHQAVKEATGLAKFKLEEEYEHMVDLKTVMAMGLAGVTSEGIVVDRRRQLNVPCVAIPANQLLGTGTPVDITPEMRLEFLQQLRAKRAAKAEDMGPVDLETIRDEFGNTYTREKFDELCKEDREAIKAYRGHLLSVVMKAGFAGMLPDGRLVDRRFRPEAKPIQKGQMPDAPEPQPVPADVT